jgi:pyruvate carboxylase
MSWGSARLPSTAHEDRYALHRFKADEAYQIGVAGEPIRFTSTLDATS